MEITDLIDPVELSLFARELVLPTEDRPDNQFQLGNWFPATLVESIEYEWNAGSTRTYTNALPFRTWSTEAPVVTRPGTARKSGEIPPISGKAPITELDKIRAREATRATPQVAEAVQDIVFGSVGRLVKGVQNRLEIAYADSLVTGAFSLSENGLDLDVSWGRDAARSDTVANAWSTPGSATPIADEQAVVETMIDGEGLGSEDLVAIMNRTTWNTFVNADQVRNSFNTVRALPFVPEGDVNELRRSLELPEAVVYNASTNTVDGTTRKVIPDGIVVYVPRNVQVGGTLWGVPASADEPGLQFDLNQRPGPVAYTMRELDPVLHWVMLDAIVMPVLAYPDATFALDVEP